MNKMPTSNQLMAFIKQRARDRQTATEEKKQRNEEEKDEKKTAELVLLSDKYIKCEYFYTFFLPFNAFR